MTWITTCRGDRVAGEKSLLRRVDQLGGDSRYVMLETIREFGWNSCAMWG